MSLAGAASLLMGLASGSAEGLAIEMPPGYAVASRQRNETVVMTEWLPHGQTLAAWSELVTTQIFPQAREVAPSTWRERMHAAWRRRCGDARLVPVAQGLEQGAPFALWTLECRAPREIAWFKAIQGHEASYLVQVAFRRPPDGEQTLRWMRMLRHAELSPACGTACREAAGR